MPISEAEVREKLEKGALRLNAVIEIVGAPKEHVEDTLRLLLKQLREEKGVDVVGGKVHEPKPQGEGPFFTTFAELDVLLKDFSALVGMCFNYMPSSIEVVEPTQFKLAPSEFSSLFNDLLGRLHEVDMRLKNTNAANILLDKNLYNLLKNAVLLALGSGTKSISELSQKVGIASEQLEPFLGKFVEERILSKNGQYYSSLVVKQGKL
ncbi:hypothetical protein HYU18_04400 [Candidatus Woesearchaeota archaeon]|nr:hypothetical protein [Candidatus Woesearchaeota archaeon]